MFSINPHVIMSTGTLQPGVFLAIRLWAKGAGIFGVMRRKDGDKQSGRERNENQRGR